MIPIIFQTKFFSLYTFWIFFAIAVIVGTYSAIKLGEKNGLKIQFLSEISWKLMLWALLGSRLLGIAVNYDIYFYDFQFSNLIQVFYIWDKGLSFWGGVLAFMIAFYYLCKKNEQDFFKWMDALVPAIVIAIAIGNIGAFFDGMNYGKETSLPWGVNFENPSVKYAVPIHPTQIYAFMYTSALAVFLFIISQLKKIKEIEPAGFIALLGAGIFSLFRFLEEFMRGDDVILIFDIRSTQIISLIAFILAGIFLYFRYNKHTKKFKH